MPDYRKFPVLFNTEFNKEFPKISQISLCWLQLADKGNFTLFGLIAYDILMPKSDINKGWP